MIMHAGEPPYTDTILCVFRQRSEKAMAPHSSTLAWKIPWVEEPGRLQYVGKEMATHSSILAWRIPGTGEPDGLPSVGSHRLGHD